MKHFGLLIFLALVMLAGCNKSSDGKADVNSIADPSRPVETDNVAGELEFVTEPMYSKPPNYCQIDLGPKREKQMWAAFDGHLMYLDLNANGDLTEKGERFIGKIESQSDASTTMHFQVGNLKFEKQTHTQFEIRTMLRQGFTTATFHVNRDGSLLTTNGSNTIALELSPYPEIAPAVHFDGPLSMVLCEDPQEMVVGMEMDFYSMVGSSGDGSGTLMAIAHKSIPEGIHPKAVFTFANREPEQPPIVVSTELMTRC